MMSGMNQATHDYIVLAGGGFGVSGTGEVRTPVQGFKNFDLAIVIVRGCQTFGDILGSNARCDQSYAGSGIGQKKLLQANAGDAAPSVVAAIKHVERNHQGVGAPIDVSASEGGCSSQGRAKAQSDGQTAEAEEGTD